VVKDLFEQLKERSQLQKLELSNANLDNGILRDLQIFIESAMRLEELDISWNKLCPQDFEALLKTLSKNKRLHELNLSWNNIAQNVIVNNKMLPAAIADPFEARKRSIDEIGRYNNLMTNYLRQFIWINRKLIHVDLSNTNLSEGMIYRLLPAIKKAKTMMSIHLTGNPGATDQLMAFAQKHMPCSMVKQTEGIDINKILKQATLNKIQGALMQEAAKAKQIQAQKKLECFSNLKSPISQQLVFTRKLGY